MWPLVSARLASVTVVLALLLLARNLSIPPRFHWPLIAMAGFADILANVFFVIATRGSLLIIASVIVSLYPASTLVLARVVFGERTTILQRLGLVLGSVAVVAISVA